MTKELFFQAIFKFLAGVALLFLLIFLPAGTLDYWNAWLLMGILFVPMFLAGIVLMCKNPDLLRKRLNAKEKEDEQSFVIKLSALLFLSRQKEFRAIKNAVIREAELIRSGAVTFEDEETTVCWLIGSAGQRNNYARHLLNPRINRPRFCSRSPVCSIT